MRIAIGGRPHLTYCTSIHPGETWSSIFDNLERFVLQVKQKIAPHCAFGIGLRLSDQASQTLTDTQELNTFCQFLRDHNLYVFTINGFPQGTFHGETVKEKVYLPDWLEKERLEYADRCARILAALLSDHPDIEGSVSTVPGAFKPRVRSDRDISRIASHLLRHAATLHTIKETTDRVITCALEPEPGCFLETIAETASFFKTHLFGDAAVEDFSRLTGLNAPQAEEVLRRHLGVCLDACHAAIEFEDPDGALSELRNNGIRILKIQLSTGLSVSCLDRDRLVALQPFAESTYLHQVVERTKGELTRYVDLPLAIHAANQRSEAGSSTREWRIHFHVPVFLKRLGPFENTQPFLTRLLRLQAEQTPTTHLEIETYTWDVLPEEFRRMPVVDAITREIQWVIETLTQ